MLRNRGSLHLHVSLFQSKKKQKHYNPFMPRAAAKVRERHIWIWCYCQRLTLDGVMWQQPPSDDKGPKGKEEEEEVEVNVVEDATNKSEEVFFFFFLLHDKFFAFVFSLIDLYFLGQSQEA